MCLCLAHADEEDDADGAQGPGDHHQHDHTRDPASHNGSHHTDSDPQGIHDAGPAGTSGSGGNSPDSTLIAVLQALADCDPSRTDEDTRGAGAGTSGGGSGVAGSGGSGRHVALMGNTHIPTVGPSSGAGPGAGVGGSYPAAPVGRRHDARGYPYNNDGTEMNETQRASWDMMKQFADM